MEKKEIIKSIIEIIEKKQIIRYLAISAICIVLISMLLIFRGGPTGYVVHMDSGDVTERGAYWNKATSGENSVLEIYNGVINYDNGSDFEPIEYGPYDTGFRDWNGLIYRVSTDPEKAYVNLYDIEDNLISRFAFGITGEVGGVNYKYTTLNFTWTWSQESIGEEYIFRAYNNNLNFNWTQEYHFYPNQSMKIKNIISNNLANINNAKFWYIQTVGAEDGIWFNGTRYNQDTYKSGEFDSLIPKIKFEDYYIFDYQDLLNNSFNITDFYLGDGDIIGINGIRILAIGVTMGNSVFPNGASVTLDPSILINGGEGEDVYVDKSSSANRNHGDKDYLKVQRVAWQRSYLQFNISAIPDSQIIDNASLCMFLDNDQGDQNISINHVYNDSWCEGDGGTDASPSCEMTWNNQPCGTDDENIIGECNASVEDVLVTDEGLDDTFQCFDVINMINSDYAGDKLSSMVLWTIDAGSADIFASKEDANSSRWPHLTIGYHTANTAPVITLDYPQEGDSYGYNTSIALNFSVSDSDANIDSCWYTLDSGVTNVSLALCANITFDVPGNGTYDLNIYVNDSLGLIDSDSASFTVQLGAPSIVLHYPIDSYLNSNSIQFNYTPTDVDLDSCWLLENFDGTYGINQTNTSVSSGVVNNFILNLSDGEYLWNIGCNDSVGDSSVDENRTFYIDTINPSLSLTEPNGEKTTKTGITLTFITSDDNLNKCYYNITTSVGTPIVNDIEVSNCADTVFDVSADGDYIFYLWSEDLAGNLNSTNSSFSVDTSETPVTPPSESPSGGGGGSSSSSSSSGGGRMQVLEIGDIIAHEGEQKTLLLNVKNSGVIFLNNCKLVVDGEVSSWIYSTQVEGIAFGQEVDFNFNLNVPEETEPGSYLGELKVDCDEGTNIQNISIIIPGLRSIEVQEIIQEKDDLKINYVFNNVNNEEEVSVDVWIVDRDGIEIKRITDVFFTDGKTEIEREILIELPKSAGGIYSIYFALSSDLESFVKKSAVLGESRTVGMAILDNAKGKFGIYIVFLLVMGVSVFFIWKRHKENNQHTQKNKNRWLIRKKGKFAR